MFLRRRDAIQVGGTPHPLNNLAVEKNTLMAALHNAPNSTRRQQLLSPVRTPRGVLRFFNVSKSIVLRAPYVGGESRPPV